MEVWIIVAKLTLLNLAPTQLLSSMAFTSQELCLVSLAGEPKSDEAMCRPINLIAGPEKAPKAPTEEHKDSF